MNPAERTCQRTNCGDTVVSLDESTGAYLSVHGEGSSAYGSWASPCYHDGNVWCGLNDYPEDAPYSSVNGGTMVADGKVYAGNWDGGQYFCLDVADGEELWNFTVEGADPGAIGGGCAQGTPAYSDGQVYLTSWLYGADAGNVYCLDADTGALVWHQNNIPDQCCGSPAIADGIVYVTTYNFYDDGERFYGNRRSSVRMERLRLRMETCTSAEGAMRLVIL